MSLTRGNITTATQRFTDGLLLEHTVAMGANGALLVFLGLNDAVTPEGEFLPPSGIHTATVTYSGFQLTYTGSVQAKGPREDPYIAAYILTSPITGTNPLVIDVGVEVNDLFVAAVNYQGVDQTNPILTFAITSTADPHFQLGGAGLQPTTTGLAITACLCSENIGDHVGGTGQTNLFNIQEGGSQFSGFDKEMPGSGYFPMRVTNIADYKSVSLSVGLRTTTTPLVATQSLEMQDANEGILNIDPTPLPVANIFSIAAWFKPAQIGIAGGIYDAGLAGESNVDEIFLGITDSGQFRAALFEEVGIMKDYAFGSYSVGVWHHVCLTWDGTSLRVYVDGVEDTTPTKTDDDAITMSSPISRVPLCGSFIAFVGARGIWHSVGVWVTGLSSEAVGALGTNPGSSWLGQIGHYDQSANMQHYYVFGEDPTSTDTMVQDSGQAGTKDLDFLANVALDDLVTDVP